MELPYETFEIRWFSADPLPVNSDLACGDLPEERTDFYLFPGNRNCSVKYRQDHLETKIRAGASHPVSTDAFEGRASTWLKWAAPWGDSPPPPSTNSGTSSPWLEIRKERWLHRFGWIGDQVAPVGNDVRLHAEFEVGAVCVEAGEWSTACVECSGGTTAEMADLLTATLGHLEQTGWITGNLPEERARSYPEWMASLPGAIL